MSTDLIGAGETYTNVLTWIAGIPGTLSENERGEHKNEQSTNSAASIDVSGFTLGGFGITLTAAAGAGFDSVMNPASDPLRLDPTKGATVLMSGSCEQFAWSVPITISKLQFKKTSNYNTIFFANAVVGGLVDQCIGLIESGSGQGLVRCNGSAPVIFDRCLLYSKTNVPGVYFSGVNLVGRNTLFANLAGGSTGFMSNYSAAYARNCPIMGYTTACSGTSAATSANNATDLSALSGTGFNAGTPQLNVVKTSAFENFTAGTEDFRLKTGSVLIGAGTATDAPSADIFGRTWNSGIPDIGPIRAAVGGGGAGITAANTLGTATSSATSKALAKNTSARTLGALTSAATVGGPRQASASQTLGQMGSTASVTVYSPTQSNNTLGQMTSAAQVKAIPKITSTPTLGAVTSVAGLNVTTASASQTLAAMTSAASLKGVAGITSAKTLGNATAAAYIAPNSVITGSSSLDAMVSQAVAKRGHVMKPRWGRRPSPTTTWTRRA